MLLNVLDNITGRLDNLVYIFLGPFFLKAMSWQHCHTRGWLGHSQRPCFALYADTIKAKIQIRNNLSVPFQGVAAKPATSGEEPG
jgi:hypothetical protein